MLAKSRWLPWVLVLGCGLEEGSAMGWDGLPSGTGGGDTSTGESPEPETTAQTSGDEGSTSGPVDPTLGEETTSGGGEPPVDCTPAWSPAFVGSPCASDGDCGFEGGYCITDDDGFPCGTCSVACDGLCPDQDGAPETFCVAEADVETGDGGTCLSRCDPGIVGGNGCREGYACTVLDRFGEPAGSTGVCVPTAIAGGGADTACQETLLELGAVFTPTAHAPESPAGYPNLICELDDPVLLYGPINGVGLEDGNGNDGPVLVRCSTAVSIVGSAAVAQMLGAETIIHYGTYNCRTIAGTSTLSEHGLGLAIDIGGFVLDDGTTASVYGHWEDGVANPVTPRGQMLRAFTDQVWAMNPLEHHPHPRVQRRPRRPLPRRPHPWRQHVRLMRGDTKVCAACGRSFGWRKKWERCWDEVRYCSDGCRRRKVSSQDEALEQAIVTLLDARGIGKTICPSEAARAVDPEDWRPLMEPARRAARRMVARGELEIRQGGEVVDPTTAKGPIRLGRP